MDNKYEKKGFIRIKEHFFFDDNILENKEIFKIKYDMNYDFTTIVLDKNDLRHIIHDEIEKSLSHQFSPLDL